MRYRFGRFELNEETRQVLAQGAEIHLTPKAFDLLTILIRNRARAMSKSELQELLWPATFVEEANLASLVAEMRRALGDSASDPVLLKTVRRFGYRFTADVIEEGDGAAAPLLRAYLVFEGRRSWLLHGVNVIGRAADATIVCDRAGVSRKHARLVVGEDGVMLEDLGSKNGTYVGADRVTSTKLTDGDTIRIGDAILTFHLRALEDPTETISA